MDPIKGYDAWKTASPPDFFTCADCGRTFEEDMIGADGETCLDCADELEDEDGVDGPFEARARRRW